MTNRERIENAIATIKAVSMDGCEKAYVMHCMAKGNRYYSLDAKEVVGEEILRIMREQNRPMRVKELQQALPLFSNQCLTAYLRYLSKRGMAKRTKKATGRTLVVSYDAYLWGVGYITKTKEIEEVVALYEAC